MTAFDRDRAKGCIRRAPRGGGEGFTLIELLIVVAILGIIAAILIPNLLDALQKAKQKRAMADQHLVGTAWMAWLSDMASAAASGRGTSDDVQWDAAFLELRHEELTELLVPQYAATLPRLDPWGTAYDFGMAEDGVDAPLPFGVRSAAADSSFEGSYPRGPFVATQYANDIVWAAGYFIRWPGGLRTNEPES